MRLDRDLADFTAAARQEWFLDVRQRKQAEGEGVFNHFSSSSCPRYLVARLRSGSAISDRLGGLDFGP